MNLVLKRLQSGPDGIFSDLLDEDGTLVAQTLEHAFNAAAPGYLYQPKLPYGEFKCVRGTHKLHDMVPFWTFEVTGVPGHTGILFHIGNYNADSDGCILLGNHVIATEGPEADSKIVKMITESKKAFAKFMALQEGVDEFTLTVT